uniref:Syntaxin binding protein 6 (amisyn), like n=1 Tax=Oryzias latipes TaxID=8090 RepID=A0A3B3HF62_ORYLA
MNIESEINKELFVPQNERLLVALEVQRRQKKRRSFLPTSSREDYTTFICVSVTNTTPQQLLITKVKQFAGSPLFTRRSQWTVEQLKQVNGINPNKDTPELDLVFDNTVDQWVASSSPEKCIFIQVLYRACQTHWEGKTEFINCQSKLTRGQTGSRGAQRTVGNVVQRMTVALGERGGRLTRAEDRTVRLMHKAQQIADTAHKVTSSKHPCIYLSI